MECSAIEFLGELFPSSAGTRARVGSGARAGEAIDRVVCWTRLAADMAG